MSGAAFKAWDRYEVLRPFEALVLTSWSAPFTGGDHKTLPVGLRFVLTCDPPETAVAIVAKAESPEKWERLLVSEGERTNKKYAGYYLVVPFDKVTPNCTKLP